MAWNIFPGIPGSYTKYDATSGLAVLERAPLPTDVIALGAERTRKIWHDKNKKMRDRDVTEDKAKILVKAAHKNKEYTRHPTMDKQNEEI